MKRAFAILLASLLAFATFPTAPAWGQGRFDSLYPPAAGGALMSVAVGQDNGEIVSLALSGRLFLALRYETQDGGQLALTLADLETGRTLARRALDGGNVGAGFDMGFLSDGRIYALSYADYTLTVFDGSLEPVARYGPFETKGVWSVRVETSGDALWLAGGEEAAVLRISLADGQIRRVDSGLPDGWVVRSFLGEEGGKIWCAFESDWGYQALGAVSGEGTMRLLPLPAGFFSQPGGILLGSRGPRALAAVLPETQRFLQLDGWREQEFALGGGDGFLLTISPGSAAPLRVYDLRKAVLAGELALPERAPHVIFSASAVSSDGFALLSTINLESSESALFLWDFAAQASARKPLRTVTLQEVRQENDRRAADMGRRFGLSVQIRQDGAGFVNESYTGTAMEDEPGIAYALDQAEAFLSALPEGLARETLTPPYKRLSLYLCGAILPKGGEGLRSVVGFSSHEGAERYIAMDARRYDMGKDLAHEFMHLMEDRLWRVEEGAADGPMAQWARLSPPEAENRGYAYSYREPDGAELYDPAYTAGDPMAGSDPGRVWFVDAYSRSFPLEDRARIFEYLFTWDAAAPSLFAYPRLAAKAQVLNAAIRNAFPSVRAMDQAPWERAVDPISYDQAIRMLKEAEEGGAE